MIIIFPSDNEYFKYMIENDGYLFEKKIENKFLSKLNRIHRSIKLNKLINMPFKSLWYNKYLEYKEIKRDECNIFIFFEGNQVGYDQNYILYLKKLYPKSKFIFRYTNILYYLNYWTVEFVNQNYDYIITMDYQESQKRGWLFWPNTYNLKLAEKKKKKSICYDIFFVGRDKGRHSQLIELCKYLSKKNIKCKFLISEVPKAEQVNNIEGIQYIDNVNYEQVIDYILQTNCILEILQENQFGSTLRPMEAIAYNKKFLTNDKEIEKQAYFNDKYMKCFSDLKSIDIQFIKDKEYVYYEQKDIISSKRLFEKVQNLVLK